MAGIKVSNLSKSFKSFKAVKDISFEVENGHVMGFLGPNGAGKTTTLRMLVGLSKPDKGEIEIADKRVVFGNAQSNTDFGYLPEAPSFYGWMTGEEYLGFIADTFRITSLKKESKIKEILKTVDLTEARHRRIAGYSNGMKQRLGIAQTLINDPKVLIMDEPVSALDPIGRREVLHVINRLKKDKTILFSTHILSDVDRVCDDVAIINKGRIIALSSITELKEKYTKPVLEVEFNCDSNFLISELKEQPWVENIDGGGNRLKIWLRDSNIINDNLPIKYLLSKNVAILKYGLILPEVEDLFVSLVEEEK